MLNLFGLVLWWGFGLASTAAFRFLLYVGNHNHWTSDGPGMLLVYMGVAATGLATVGFWVATVIKFLCWVYPPFQRVVDFFTSTWLP